MVVEHTRCSGGARSERMHQGPIAEAMVGVKHKVAIISGKGGVGKTSLTVNLGRALLERGRSVGIFDADIHGPGVHKMLGLRPGSDIMHGGFHLTPPKSPDGIKVMSVALIWPGEMVPAMWRGPYKMKVIRQFLCAAVWEEMDFLLIDLPPGTGDEVLAIMEAVPGLDGVLVVTTPQEVATTICGKAINAAREMGVRVLGVVENMGSLRCPHCGEEIHLFGRDGGREFARNMEVPFLGRIPFDNRINEAADEGVSLVGRHPDIEVVATLRAIAGSVISILETGGDGDGHHQ